MTKRYSPAFWAYDLAVWAAVKAVQVYHYETARLVEVPGTFGDEYEEVGSRCVCGDEPCYVLALLDLLVGSDQREVAQADDDDPYAHYPGGWEGWMKDTGRGDDI